MINLVTFLVLFSVSTFIACIVASLLWCFWFVLVGGTVTFFPTMQTAFIMIIMFNVFYWGVKVLLED